MSKGPLAHFTLLLALSLVLGGAEFARAAEPADAPTPAPSASTQVDPNFLLLPAYDLDWESPTQSVRVGDTLRARIKADGPDAGKPAPLPRDLQIKVPPGTLGGDDLSFALPDGASVDPDGSLALLLTPVKAGQITLPSLAVADSTGKYIGRTEPLTLNVASAIASNDPKPKQPDPPRPPVSLAIPLATLIILAVLALGVVAAALFWLIRWSRSRHTPAPVKIAEPPKPEDEIALGQLGSLEKRGLLKSGQFKAHYFAISEIIKHYLGARYEFDAAESTTFEMLSWLEQRLGSGGPLAPMSIPQSAIDSLRGIFDRLDRVKFTDHVPGATEGLELIEEARQLVRATKRPAPLATLPSAQTVSQPVSNGAGSDAVR